MADQRREEQRHGNRRREGGRREGEQERSGERGGGGEERGTPNWLEKLVSGVSLILLLGAIGYLAWEGTRPTADPSFEATVQRVWQPDEDYHVLLEVRNAGGRSVQNLGIHAEVLDGRETLARTSATLSWLPARSTRRATVILGADPREHTLEVGFEGYEIP